MGRCYFCSAAGGGGGGFLAGHLRGLQSQCQQYQVQIIFKSVKLGFSAKILVSPVFSSLRVLGVVARAFPLEGGLESPELYQWAAANRKPSFTSILSATTVAIACIVRKATSSGRIPHSPRSRRPLLQLSAAGQSGRAAEVRLRITRCSRRALLGSLFFQYSCKN